MTQKPKHDSPQNGDEKPQQVPEKEFEYDTPHEPPREKAQKTN